MYFTDDDGYPKLSVSAALLNLLTLDNIINNFTYWTSTGISSEKIKPFDPSLAPIMSNLASVRVSIKSSDSVLVHKYFSSLYSNASVNS